MRMHFPRLLCVAVLLALGGGVALLSQQAASEKYRPREFRKFILTDEYWSEGANWGDFNRDGQADVVCGPYWYEAPDFRNRHEIHAPVKPAGRTPDAPLIYSQDSFFAFVYDLNRDGWPDILTVGFPTDPAYWYENPRGGPGHWKKRVVLTGVAHESPIFGNLVGDAHPELVCVRNRKLGYAVADPLAPDEEWKFHALSPGGTLPPPAQGLGVGDVNGDGRIDVIEKGGWWEQPASLSATAEWPFHSYRFADPGGAQMFAYDVNGDGLNDIITSLDGHGWGLAWFEQMRSPDGSITFNEHRIMGEKPEENQYGVSFSQLHALDLADIDGDGFMDIVTGKCYRAHDFLRDPGRYDPAVLYYFRLQRLGGKVDFVPHQIDAASGVGRQVVTGKINGDGLMDIVVGNKNGAFLFLQTGPDDSGALRKKKNRDF